MKIPLSLWFASLVPLAAIPATTTLNLVSDPAFNRVTVTVNPQVGLPISLADTDTTVLTGSVDATFNVDPQAGTTVELTLSNGRASGTAMNFSKTVLTTGYNINMTGLSAAIDTIAPPGTVNPLTGEFPAEEHQFVIDQGTISGTALGNPVNTSFSPESSAGGAGTGTGTVVLTAAGDSGIYRNFNVTVTFPVAIDDSFDADGTLVAVTASGTLKATGTLQVPRSAYLAWTVDENISGAGFEDDANGDGVSNGLLWALGLGIDDDPFPYLPRPDPAVAGGFLVPLPPGGSAGPILIQSSDSLASWPSVAATGLSAPANPLPAGSVGTVAVFPDGSPKRFVRLKVTEP